MKQKVGLEFRRDWMPSPEKWFRTARHREEKELHPVWNGNNAPEQD
jgi:2',3'-cyclic-nucleotide 2'-phosphodiesterase/3'-nucleotidase